MLNDDANRVINTVCAWYDSHVGEYRTNVHPTIGTVSSLLHVYVSYGVIEATSCYLLADEYLLFKRAGVPVSRIAGCHRAIHRNVDCFERGIKIPVHLFGQAKCLVLHHQQN